MSAVIPPVATAVSGARGPGARNGEGTLGGLVSVMPPLVLVLELPEVLSPGERGRRRGPLRPLFPPSPHSPSCCPPHLRCPPPPPPPTPSSPRESKLCEGVSHASLLVLSLSLSSSRPSDPNPLDRRLSSGPPLPPALPPPCSPTPLAFGTSPFAGESHRGSTGCMCTCPCVSGTPSVNLGAPSVYRCEGGAGALLGEICTHTVDSGCPLLFAASTPGTPLGPPRGTLKRGLTLAAAAPTALCPPSVYPGGPPGYPVLLLLLLLLLLGLVQKQLGSCSASRFDSGAPGMGEPRAYPHLLLQEPGQLQPPLAAPSDPLLPRCAQGGPPQLRGAVLWVCKGLCCPLVWSVRGAVPWVCLGQCCCPQCGV